MIQDDFDPLTAPIEVVERVLKARGWDPEEIAQRGREFVAQLLVVALREVDEDVEPGALEPARAGDGSEDPAEEQ